MSAGRRVVRRPWDKSYRRRAPRRTVSWVASAAAVLVLGVSGGVNVVLTETISMRVPIGVLAGGALLGHRPRLTVFLRPVVGIVAHVLAGHLWSPCAVARHGSHSLGPHKRKRSWLRFLFSGFFFFSVIRPANKPRKSSERDKLFASASNTREKERRVFQSGQTPGQVKKTRRD